MATGQRPVLPALSHQERSSVLERLLDSHPELRDEAEDLACAHLAAVDADTVADQIVDTYTAINFQAIAGRVGPRRGRGYVNEVEAQHEVLAETLAPFLREVTHRCDLGFDDAISYARAVTAGLERLRQTAGQQTLVGWGECEENTAALVSELTFTLDHAGLDPQTVLDDHWYGYLG